jgi:hypothetical protein
MSNSWLVSRGRVGISYRVEMTARKPVNIVEKASKLELNRSGSLDDKLRFAIDNRRLIQLRYSAKLRIVERHDFGLQKQAARLLAFQRGGGDRHGSSTSDWRISKVAKIEECVVLENTFAGSRGAMHDTITCGTSSMPA